MQQHLIQHAAEYIAVALMGCCHFHSLRDRAAEASGRSRKFCKNFFADLCRHGRRWRDLCTIGAHDLAAERLLLIGYFYHKYVAIQIKIAACHG